MSSDVKAMCARLADERLADLASERWEVAFTAYLDRLQARYPDDPAMRAYLERSMMRLAERGVSAP